MFPLFATSVIDTGSKFAAGGIDTGGKLPPVSTTLAKLVAKFVAGVVDTGAAPCILLTNFGAIYSKVYAI